MSKIKLEINPGNSGSRVWIDGIEQNFVREISLTHVAGEPPVLELTHFLTEPVSIVGQAEVRQVTLCPACRAAQTE